jgi:hypothetical protein
MILRLGSNPSIDNLRRYPAETVEKLRNLLATGVPAIPDPRRQGFYDLRDGHQVYFIHISPTGRVLFLATWPDERAVEASRRLAFRAEACASGR